MKRHILSASIVGVFVAAACSGDSSSNPDGGVDASVGDTGLPPQDGDVPADAGPIVAPQPISPFIVVDQFGYQTGDEKIAVLRTPVTGFDKGTTYTPAAKYALVDAHTSKTITELTPTAWNGGATDPSSGDKAWWLDFSSTTTPSDYFVLDETANVRSDVFRISTDVYSDVLVQAVRMFYYQRDGMAKDAQYAGAAYADTVEHANDATCTLYNGATVKDLHGGWWDAGDQNKYVNWAASDVIVLLRAFVETPNAFSDATNIPESGNGVPDLLDEIKWELDWLVRMQNSDGSVLSIVGQDGAKPPSQGGSKDTRPSTVTTPCKYGPQTTAASFSTSAAFAFASMVYANNAAANAKYPGFATDLASRAKTAWTWAKANPNVTFMNTGVIGAGEQEPATAADRELRELQASAFLWELTSDTQYRTYFDANYGATELGNPSGGNLDMFDLENVDTLLEYAKATGSTASVVTDIHTRFKSGFGSDNNLGSTLKNSDPYLGYLYVYVWGSNQTKADQGNLLFDNIAFGIDATKNADAHRGAERYVHWVHGVNPLALEYLTNMGDHGAAKSTMLIYHSWYENGSNYQTPPPGYLPGGPNPTYTWDGCCPNNCSGFSCGTAQLSPPAGQPNQKAYFDFDDDWPLDSWQVTEPDLGYQAKYVRLLSKFTQ